MQRNRFITAASVALIVGLATGCSPSPTPTPVSTAAPSAAATPAPTETAALPDPALTNVKTNVAAARAALITSAGGAISAIDGNGAAYTLNIPAGAVIAPTEIAMYPVTSLASLPAGATLVAAVQFTPDGLQLRVPATLTITLPSAVDAALTGIVWHGDGQSIYRAPLTGDGQAVTLGIDHFSGGGAWLPPAAWAAALNCGLTDYGCQTDEATDLMTIQRRTATNLLQYLRTWYRDTVAPFFQAEGRQAAADATNTTPDSASLNMDQVDVNAVYGGWLSAIGVARSWLRNPAFTVSPELTDSRAHAVLILRDLYLGYNRVCAGSGADVLHAIESADLGIRLHYLAERLGIATRANGLDHATLVDQSCAQIVIGPNPSYTGKVPGDAGSAEVDLGYTIAQGPVSSGQVIQVDTSLPGSNNGFHAFANAGHYSQVIPWPAGVNPLNLDVAGTLQVNDPRLAPLGLGTYLTEITRSVRITKHAEDLFKYTFDFDFDGWSRDTITPIGSTTYGEADHTSMGGGVIHLDGRGATSAPKAWIFKTIALPDTAKYLFFDVSAEIIAGSSSSVAVRIVAADGTDKLLLRPTAVHNSTNGLSFVRKRLDISQWAGQDVTIYIEQTYNQIGNFDKEIYIDNVRITAV